MDLSSPHAPSEPLPPPNPTSTSADVRSSGTRWSDDGFGDDRVDVESQRIVGGVAALVADRLAIDALWVRLGFVILALVGGIGLLVYAGLWLALIVGPTRELQMARVLGGAMLVIGVPLALNANRFEFSTGPGTVVLLLAGLTLALWQPRRQPSARRDMRDVLGPEAESAAADSASQAPPGPERVRHERVRHARARRFRTRERSPLGRATLGTAIVVAAAGALIDEVNGGRFHPEQWLGPAAMVCGLGLLIGGFRGRTRWLVVPALAFASGGYAGGHMSRLGISVDELAGDRYVQVIDSESGGGPQLSGTVDARVAFGTVYVWVGTAPATPGVVDARVAIGEINVDVAEGVTVLVRTHVANGSVRVDGASAATTDVVVGPAGQPDVTVHAWVGRGSVNITSPSVETAYVTVAVPVPVTLPVPQPAGSVGAGAIVVIADGVGVTSDGWFVLGSGEAVIDASDRVVAGEQQELRPGTASIMTSFGEFQLLPRGLLITPAAEVIDLHAIRAELAGKASDPTGTPTTTTSLAPTATTGG